MRQLNEQQKLDWKIVTTPGHDQSFRLFVDWQADAFATDDVLLSGFIAKNKANAELAVVRDFLSYDPYGLMCRKGDPSFAAVIERTFARLAEARQIVQLYGKWFLDRLLTGERLGRPITPQLKEILHTIGLPEERGSGGVGPRLAIVAPPGGPPCNQHRLPAAAATAKDEPAMSETLTVATTETIKLDKVETRLEHDLLGETEVPNTACWGVHTKRAVENFPITGVPIGHFPELVKALAMVKQAAARANKKLAFLTRDKAEAIERACELIVQGHHHDQFVVDAIQGGAGTSTNMNANEVIANLALELMGRPKGDYDALHPNNDVNMSQSTNDAYPTALRLAIILASAPLVKALEDFAYALKGKAVEFGDVLKMGRTQLQDAVPMTLGQEFDGFHVTVKEDIARIREIVGLFREVNLGATAIGTGINTDPRYASLAVEELARVSGQPMVLAGNLVEATSDMGAFVLFSGLLKRIAVKLSKICNDLRLLSSGPRTGFGEIRLPPMQAGSSIMPGKVNPVIPEVVNQVAFLVIGHDLTVTLCAEGGQLQLNAFEPTIGFCTLQSMRMLAAGLDTLTKRCIEGIEADVERCRGLAINSIGIVTVLNPVLGYDVCSRIAKRALNENRSVLDIVLEEGVLTKEQVTELLRPEKMTQPARATIA